MAGENTLATLDGLFKEQYSAKGVENLIPMNKKLQDMFKFNNAQKNGGRFVAPVILAMEHGVTYASEDDGAFTLNPSIAGQMKDASVSGYQILLRSALAYNAAYRAKSSAQAFQDSTKLLVANMLDSIRAKLEIQLMFGQSGIGVVETTTANGSNVVVPVKDEYWAPGVWAGAEGMKVDFYTGATPVAGCTGMTITAVSFENKTITISALGGTGVTALDTIYPYGAYGKEMVGLHKLLTQSSGDLFGISTTNSLWKGNLFTPGTYGTPVVLTFSIIQQAISKAVEKGLDKDVKVLVNPGHWDDLLVDESSLRNYDSSYKSDTAENGAKAIKFYSQNGMIEIVPSTMVMEGYAYIICAEDFQRIGSTDVTFRRPSDGESYFRELDNSAGYELRVFSEQALFCVKPSRNVVIRNLKVS